MICICEYLYVYTYRYRYVFKKQKEKLSLIGSMEYNQINNYHAQNISEILESNINKRSSINESEAFKIKLNIDPRR
jgi:hypothetical protein